MIRRNVIKEDLENLIPVNKLSGDQLDKLIDYIQEVDKKATFTEIQIWKILQRKYQYGDY